MLGKLEQIKTRDGLSLEGLFFRPRKRGRAAAFWVAGLSGRFSGSPKRTLTLAKIFSGAGIAFAVFDHRGFGAINFLKQGRGKKQKYFLAGSAFEKFEHCIFDIEAVIRFLRKQGYKKIFLLGHSTGANKSAYYYWKTRGQGLAGVGLLGPISDILVQKKRLGKKFKKALRLAEKMVKGGKGDKLLPTHFTDGDFWTAQRFVSLVKVGMREDTFSYYDHKRKFFWAKRIKLPLLVLFGGKDQYASRPVKEILESFKKQIPAKFFTGKILPGADHGFAGKERELARTIKNWIKGRV